LSDIEREPNLTVRPLALLAPTASEPRSLPLQRQVMLVTTTDRMNIPPIASFCELVIARAKEIQLSDIS
jgi:hypothetical protein